MIQAGTKDVALKKLDLLDEVVSFKRKFYRCSWARYEQATSIVVRKLRECQMGTVWFLRDVAGLTGR